MTTTEPVNGHRVSGTADLPQQRPEPAATSGNSQFEEVQKLALEQDKNHQLQDIQNDPVFRTVLSDEEMDADRDVDEEIRAADRERRRTAGLARVERQGKHDEAQGKIDGEDLKEKVDLRKAQRKRRSFTDGAAALVSVYRNYRLVSTLLLSTTVVGIAWTSYNFATGLNGGEVPTNPLLFGIEPMFSVPLVCIVLMQMVASMRGRLHQVAPTKSTDRGRRLTMVGWIEVSLLVGTTVIGLWPSLLEIFGAAPFNGQMFGARLCAPMLVVLSVALQLVAAEVFGDIIRDATLDGDNDDSTVRERAKRGADRAALVIAAMREGSIELQPDGYPSVKEISRRFPCEKAVAQTTRDILPTFVEGVK